MSDNTSEADQWHEGLHRLVGTHPQFDTFEPVEHFVPCDIQAADIAPFASLDEGRLFFEDFASSASDSSLVSDAISLIATLQMMSARQRPQFYEMVRSIFGVELELPTKERLTEARQRAEEAFFTAFPALGGRNYNQETVADGLKTRKHERSFSDNEIRQTVADVADAVLNTPTIRQMARNFEIEKFEADPILVAHVWLDEAGNTKFGFNKNFDPSATPGDQARLMVHESVHVVQVAYGRALYESGQLPASQMYGCPFTSALVASEMAANNAQRFLPAVGQLEIVADPLVHWKLLNQHVYWLEFVNILNRTDSIRYTAADAIKDMNVWSADPANPLNVSGEFDFFENNVTGRLMTSPYALGHQYVDKALQTGGLTARNMVTEAIRRPVSAPELVDLAKGQSLVTDVSLA